jgi:hypothetical protein
MKSFPIATHSYHVRISCVAAVGIDRVYVLGGVLIVLGVMLGLGVGLVELSIIDKVVLSNHRVIRVMETHVL